MINEEKKFEPKGLFKADNNIAGEVSSRRVRVLFGGEFIADSKTVLLLREHGRLPAYYFPHRDVRTDLLEKTEKVAQFPNLGDTQFWNINVGNRTARNAAYSHPGLPEDRFALRDHFAFKWDEMDAWFEEDEQVFVHPRDPYKRVDVMPSSRHIRVEVDGIQIADSHRPYLLFETWLPTRYYLPRRDVRMDLLEESDTYTSCPYKGTASYYSVRIGDQLHKDLVWTYPDPIPECPKIANLLAFFNEKVDILVDGELQPRPQTPWS